MARLWNSAVQVTLQEINKIQNFAISIILWHRKRCNYNDGTRRSFNIETV